MQHPDIERHVLEASHGRDPLVLHAAALLALVTPWNLALWWLNRRLRLAVELDCDARVLAGKLEGDDAETCARKEAEEETGYRAGELIKAYDCFMSPGSVTERLTLYIGFVDSQAGGAGGGLHHEGEDIEVIRLPFAQALEMVASGEIIDAKTILLLQYAALNGILS